MEGQGRVTFLEGEAAAHVDDARDIVVLGRVKDDAVAALAVAGHGNNLGAFGSPKFHRGTQILDLLPVIPVHKLPLAFAVAGEIESECGHASLR